MVYETFLTQNFFSNVTTKNQAMGLQGFFLALFMKNKAEPWHHLQARQRFL